MTVIADFFKKLLPYFLPHLVAYVGEKLASLFKKKDESKPNQ
jgi:hypothetical protein